MPWYTTRLQSDGSPLNANRLGKASDDAGYHIGCYGTRVYARSKRHAEALARVRGMNEVLCLKSRAPSYPRASGRGTVARLASMRFTIIAARTKKPSGITTKTITAAAVFIYLSLQEVPTYL